MKRITRDDTEHGVEYYRANEVDSLLTDQPAQQEPVAWIHPDGRIWTFGRGLDKSTFTVPLYTSPPAPQDSMHPEIKKMYEDYFDKCFRASPPAQRTWVGLTDDEIQECWYRTNGEAESFGRAMEAKLKELNT